jgi:uncharacterized membrane protein YdjX (TVP38/TMEM64 family)
VRGAAAPRGVSSPRPSRPRLRLALLGGALAIALVLVVGAGASPDRVRGWVEGFGALGPVVFVVAAALLTVVLFPGPVLHAGAGLLFGTALGTVVAILAAALGGGLAFGLSRRVGRAAVEDILGDRLTGMRGWLERRGFYGVLYARIAPGVPYHVLNHVAGLTRMPVRAFLAATTIAVSPRAFAYAALGGSWGDFTSPEVAIAVALLIVLAVAGGALLRRDLRRERAAAALGKADEGVRSPGPGTARWSPGARSEGRR